MNLSTGLSTEYPQLIKSQLLYVILDKKSEGVIGGNEILGSGFRCGEFAEESIYYRGGYIFGS